MTNIELGASYPFWENRACLNTSCNDAPLFVKMDANSARYGVCERDFSMQTTKKLIDFPYFTDSKSNFNEFFLRELLYNIFNYSQFRRKRIAYYSINNEIDKSNVVSFFAIILKQLANEPRWHAWQTAIMRQLLLDLNKIPIDKGPMIEQPLYNLELCSEAETKFLTAIQENDMVLVDGHLLVKSHRESNKDVRGYLAGLCIRNATYPNGTYFQSGVWYCPTDRKAIRASFAQNGQIDISASAWVPIRPFYPSNLDNEQLAEFVAKVKNLISNNYHQLKL